MDKFFFFWSLLQSQITIEKVNLSHWYKRKTSLVFLRRTFFSWIFSFHFLKYFCYFASLAIIKVRSLIFFFLLSCLFLRRMTSVCNQEHHQQTLISLKVKNPPDGHSLLPGFQFGSYLAKTNPSSFFHKWKIVGYLWHIVWEGKSFNIK